MLRRRGRPPLWMIPPAAKNEQTGIAGGQSTEWPDALWLEPVM